MTRPISKTRLTLPNIKPCCNLPIIPNRFLNNSIDPNREFLIRYIEKKWVNYTVIHYYFIDTPKLWKGNNRQKQVVRESFKVWKDLGIGPRI